jgi:hypothetical protein
MLLTASPLLLSLALVAAVTLLRAYRRFTEQAEDLFGAWAALQGFEPLPAPSVAGQLPQRLAVYAAPVGAGGRIGGWTWTPGAGHDTRPVHMVTVEAVLSAGFPNFRVVPADNAVLVWPGEHEVALESVEFNQTNRLLSVSKDPADLLQVFTPDEIVWWIEQGEQAPTVRYQLGSLVVSSRAQCESFADFDRLLAQARRIAEGVLSEGLLRRA